MGGEGGQFVVFTDPATKRFIQFAPVGAKHFLVEVVGSALSQEEVLRLPEVFDGIERTDYTSYTTACKLDVAVELADQFFRDVCKLPESFMPESEVETGVCTCDLCGQEVDEAEPEPDEILLGEADELDFKKEVVADLIRASVATVQSGGVVPDDEIDATCDSVKVDGPVYPVLCPACSERLAALRRSRTR